MKKIMIRMIVMLGLVICGLIMTGCLDSMPKSVTGKTAPNVPDPEAGIAAWITAVNDRDYGAVYDLMPASKRTGISRVQFIRFNQENPSPFIASGLVVDDYFILEKRVTGLNATVVAGLRTIRPPGSDGEPPRPNVASATAPSVARASSPALRYRAHGSSGPAGA
jgi:hypothetical protein